MYYNVNEFSTAEQVMSSFCKFISKDCNYLVNKESALRLAYGSDRVLNNLEIDAYSTNRRVCEELINEFCCRRASGFKFVRETKYKRIYSIQFGDTFAVQVAIRFVPKNLDFGRVTKVNGMYTYKLSEIVENKVNNYLRSGGLRDMDDLLFISNNYWHHIPDSLRGKIKSIVHEWTTNPKYNKQLIESRDSSINKSRFIDELHKLSANLGV